jgi:hypothetical protein
MQHQHDNIVPSLMEASTAYPIRDFRLVRLDALNVRERAGNILARNSFMRPFVTNQSLTRTPSLISTPSLTNTPSLINTPSVRSLFVMAISLSTYAPNPMSRIARATSYSLAR